MNSGHTYLSCQKCAKTRIQLSGIPGEGRGGKERDGREGWVRKGTKGWEGKRKETVRERKAREWKGMI